MRSKYASTPIRWVVETVWNNGLLKAWKALDFFLPGTAPGPISLAFASGGPVPFGKARGAVGLGTWSADARRACVGHRGCRACRWP